MLNCYLSNAARCLRFCAVVLSVFAGSAHAAPFAYITNAGSNKVSVIDTAINTVVATVAIFAGYGLNDADLIDNGKYNAIYTVQ